MLKIKNAAGEELMKLNDDGTEELVDKKFKDQYENPKNKVQEDKKVDEK